LRRSSPCLSRWRCAIPRSRQGGQCVAICRTFS
jgi:hypothetical protein